MTPVTPGELVTLLIIGGGLWALVQFTGLKFWHAALVFGRGTVRLLDPVVGARQRIGEIDRKHPLAGHAIGFHPPHRGDPQRRVVAIAVHEQDRWRFGRSGGSGRSLSRCCEIECAGQ